MVKFLSKFFVMLWGVISNPSLLASAQSGLSTISDVMIIQNLAGKDPWVKIGDLVLYVPKKCIGMMKYALDFLSKHKVITLGVLSALGVSMFWLFKSALVAEGINSAKEFFKNIFFGKDEVLKEIMNDNLSSKLLTADSLDSVSSIIDANSFSNGPNNPVPLKFGMDMDNNGEISAREYFRTKHIEKLVSKCQPEMLELLQIVAEDNIDYVDMLKYFGYYRVYYEKI